MSFAAVPGLIHQMKPVVHLELHTGDLQGARAFYAELFGWKQERIEAGQRSYLALELGRGLGGGIVECATDRALWLPYVEVAEIRAATEGARASGAARSTRAARGPRGLAKRRCHARRRRDRALAAEALSFQPRRRRFFFLRLTGCTERSGSAGSSCSRLRRVRAKRSAMTVPMAPTFSAA